MLYTRWTGKGKLLLSFISVKTYDLDVKKNRLE